MLYLKDTTSSRTSQDGNTLSRITVKLVFSEEHNIYQHRIQDGRGGGGTMKYKGPPMAAIFFYD